jgi:hypothetical protein
VFLGAGCGASVWVELGLELPAGVEVVDGSTRAVGLHPVSFGSLIPLALGGVSLGAVILVGGDPGAGKTTLCAQAASEQTDRFRSTLWWLDADVILAGAPLLRRELVFACFDRMSSSRANLRLVQARRSPDAMLFDATVRSLSVGPKDVIVVDSLQKWGRSEAGVSAVILSLMSCGATVYAISRANASGALFGWMEHQHDVDAVALVQLDAVFVPKKCRWSSTPRGVQRPNGEPIIYTRSN